MESLQFYAVKQKFTFKRGHKNEENGFKEDYDRNHRW